MSCISIQAQSNFPAKDIETIKTSEENYRASWMKNDEKTILSLFTDDATLYLGGNPPIKGKEALRKFWFAPSTTVTTLTAFDVKIEDVSGSGDFAAVTGSAEIRWTTENKTGQKRFLAKEHFMVVYVKQNKEWKIWKRFGTNKTEEIK